MTFPLLIFITVGLALLMVLVVVFFWLPKRRRQHRSQLRTREFPEAWSELLRRDFPLYEKLPAELRERLHGLVQVFLNEKNFEACGGLDEVDERMRLLIAAQACVLLLGLGNHGHYPRLRSVLVYFARC